MEEYPDSALAWYGVGCYYMASKQFEQARRFFAKATQLDRHNAYAWIAFGHAFAEQVTSHSFGMCCWQCGPLQSANRSRACKEQAINCSVKVQITRLLFSVFSA